MIRHNDKALVPEAAPRQNPANAEDAMPVIPITPHEDAAAYGRRMADEIFDKCLQNLNTTKSERTAC